MALIACTNNAPTEGTWDISEAKQTVDSCSLMTGTESEDWSMTLSNSEDSEFTLKDDDGKPLEQKPLTHRCTLVDQDFTCEADEYEFPYEGITYQNSVSVSGSFPSQTTLKGTVVSEIDCEGDGCESFADFPCTIEFEITGEYSE